MGKVQAKPCAQLYKIFIVPFCVAVLLFRSFELLALTSFGVHSMPAVAKLFAVCWQERVQFGTAAAVPTVRSPSTDSKAWLPAALSVFSSSQVNAALLTDFRLYQAVTASWLGAQAVSGCASTLNSVGIGHLLCNLQMASTIALFLALPAVTCGMLRFQVACQCKHPTQQHTQLGDMFALTCDLTTQHATADNCKDKVSLTAALLQLARVASAGNLAV